MIYLALSSVLDYSLNMDIDRDMDMPTDLGGVDFARQQYIM